MIRIFISYRHDDSRDLAQRISETLCATFGRRNVFTDVVTVQPGEVFPEKIKTALRRADVVIPVIGRKWLLADDGRGVHNPTDWVREEVEIALRLRKPIIPVVINGMKVPRAADLPDPIRALSDIAGIPVRPDPSFRRDMEPVIEAILGRVPLWPALLWRIRRYLRRKLPLPAAALLIAVATAVAAALWPAGPYDPDFLGVTVPLPRVQGGGGDLLDYTHFSIVMDPARKMALYTAANIDRSRHLELGGGSLKWIPDPRTAQLTETVFAHNAWDHGDLVAHQDVMWAGKFAWRRMGVTEQAWRDTYFFTNSVPMRNSFDLGIWTRLERHVREGIEPQAEKASVFTGPVFRASDIQQNGTPIPQSLWKIAIVDDPQQRGKLLVFAYLLDQYAVDSKGDAQTIPYTGADLEHFRVPVDSIEKVTPLRFGDLKKYDTYAGN